MAPPTQISTVVVTLRRSIIASKSFDNLWKYILCLIHCSHMIQCVFPHFYKPVICTNLLNFPSNVWSGTLTCTPRFSPPGCGEPGGRGLGQPGASEPPSHSAARRWDIFIMAWQTARFLPQRKGPNILSNPKVVPWQRVKLSVNLKDNINNVTKEVVYSTFTLLVPSQTRYLSNIFQAKHLYHKSACFEKLFNLNFSG